MKTQQQFEEDLYKRTQEHHHMGIAMRMVFGIVLLIGVIVWLNGNPNYFEIGLKVAGYLFLAAFFCIGCYYFFFPIKIEKEKERLTEKLKKLMEQRDYFGEIALAEAQNQNPENHYSNLFQKTQEKIWELELRLRMLGEKIEQE